MIITTHCWSLKKRGKETDKSLFHTDFELEVLNIVKFINIYIYIVFLLLLFYTRSRLFVIVIVKRKRKNRKISKSEILNLTSFPFRSSPNQTEEDRTAASAGPETQSHDRPADHHHSDRPDRDQGTRRWPAVPSPLRSGCPEGVAHATTTPRQGDLRSRETRDPPRTLAQVAGGVESTLQRLGP